MGGGGVIGYYVHHQGRGHASRAASIAAATEQEVVVLSSLARPAGWTGGWVLLDRDDGSDDPSDVDAGGRLHWVPLHDSGLAARMAAVSSWILANRPSLLVVDVSVEIAVLARLHGVPVVTFALPGDRGDEPHALGFDLADTVIACWPDGLAGIAGGLSVATKRKLRPVGAISRFRRSNSDPVAVPRTVLVLSGAGGAGPRAALVDAARRATPGWTWTMLDGAPGSWVDDPWPLICAADVVITHAGQNALADVAAAGRPAIVVPQERPHDEQRWTARALARDGAFPVVVLDAFPESGWESLLEHARTLDGRGWGRWNDGEGAVRAARILDERAASFETVSLAAAP